MSTSRRVGRGIVVVLGAILMVIVSIAIGVTALGITAAGVCVATSDPNCANDPTYSGATVHAEPGPDGSAILVMQGQRSPGLPDAYIDDARQRSQQGPRLTSMDAATDTFRFSLPVAPVAGASTDIQLELNLPPRTGIDGCAERRHGIWYDTIIKLRLHRWTEGELRVTDVVTSHVHRAGSL